MAEIHTDESGDYSSTFGFSECNFAMRDVSAGHVKLGTSSDIAFVRSYSMSDVFYCAKASPGMIQHNCVVCAVMEAFC